MAGSILTPPAPSRAGTQALRAWPSHRAALVLIILGSLWLNNWGSHWGLPERWHPDEITMRTIKMVERHSLNPRYFAYGNLHFYQVAAFAVIPVKLASRLGLPLDASRAQVAMLWLARALSAALGAGIVLAVYGIGRTLFDRRAGLLGAACVALTMGVVNLSHFATTEIPSIFWFTLSCFMSARLLADPRPRWYALAGWGAGFSGAVKYIGGGTALVPLTVAHLLARAGRHSYLALGFVTAGAAFLLGNPTTLFAPGEFLEGFVEEGAYNSARGAGDRRAFIPLAGELVNALGVPLFAICAAGAAYGLWLAARGGGAHGSKGQGAPPRSAVLLVWSMVLPQYLLMGSLHASLMRYIIPVVPVLLVFAGKLLADLTRIAQPALRAVSRGALALALGYSALYCIAADLTFSHDPRYLAAEWIQRHAPPGSLIEVTAYGPSLPARAYRVMVRPRNNLVDETAARTRQGGAYRLMHALLARWHGASSYTPWYEQASARYQRDAQAFDMSLAGLVRRAPAYLVVSDFYASRFDADSTGTVSPEQELFQALFAGTTPYRQVAALHYRFAPWLHPEVEKVSSTVWIFQREP